MKIGVTALKYLNNLFPSLHTLIKIEEETHQLNNDNSNYKKAIIINKASCMEVPLLCNCAVLHFLHYLKESQKQTLSKIVMPLHIDSVTIECKSFTTLLFYFTENNHSRKLFKVITKDNVIYYVGFGIILDKDLNPLVLMTRGIKYTFSNEDTDSYKYPNNTTCYINEDVFKDKNNILSKGFLNNVIPYFAIKYISYRTLDNKCFKYKVNVVFEGIEKFFTEPKEPNTINNLNEDINNCLISNINNIKYALDVK